MSDFTWTNDSLWTSLDTGESDLPIGFDGLVSTGFGADKADTYGAGIAPASLIASTLPPAPSTSSGSSPEADTHGGKSSDEWHPPEKRKGVDGETHSHKDARRGNIAVHTHEGDDDDEAAAAAPATGGRRKSGGGPKAPITERRRAQNRAAQTAFRERKTAHLKNLEDTISALKADNTERVSENKNLRDLVEQLRQENERLRATSSSSAPQSAPAPSLAAFTFQVPKATPATSPPTIPTPAPSKAGASPFSAASFPMGGETFGRASAKQRSPSLPFDSENFQAVESDAFLRSMIASPPLVQSPDLAPPASRAPSYDPPAATEPDLNLFTPRGEHLSDSFFSLGSVLSPPPMSAIAGASPNAAASPAAAWTNYRESSSSSSGSNAKPTPANAAFALEDIDSYLSSGALPAGFDADISPTVSPPVVAAQSASQSPLSTAIATPPGATEPSSVFELSRQYGVAEPDLNILCAEFKQKATCTEAARMALQKALSQGQHGDIDDARKIFAGSDAEYRQSHQPR